MEWYHKALEIDPNFRDALMNLGILNYLFLNNIQVSHIEGRDVVNYLIVTMIVILFIK